MLFSYMVIPFLRVDRSLGGSIACIIYNCCLMCIPDLWTGRVKFGLQLQKTQDIIFSKKLGNHS